MTLCRDMMLVSLHSGKVLAAACTAASISSWGEEDDITTCIHFLLITTHHFISYTIISVNEYLSGTWDTGHDLLGCLGGWEGGRE